MRKLSNRLTVITLIILIFVQGCGAKLAKLKGKTVEDGTLTASDVISELKSRYDLTQTLKSWVNVSIKSEGQKYEVRELLYYKRPDKLRVQAMGPLNEARAIVLSSDQKITLFFVQEKEARVGDLSDDTLKQIFDIDVRISDIKSSIFANPFLDGKTEIIRMTRSSDGYLLSRPHPFNNYTEEITVSPNQIAVKQWRIVDSEGRVVQRANFSDYRQIGGVIRPLKAVIERFDKPIYLSFEAVEPQINLDLSDALFTMKLPEGTKILPIKGR